MTHGPGKIRVKIDRLRLGGLTASEARAAEATLRQAIADGVAGFDAASARSAQLGDLTLGNAKNTTATAQTAGTGIARAVRGAGGQKR